MSHIDLDPVVVTSSGRATAATATDWESWAGRAETLLRTAAAGVQEGQVSTAFEEYLSTWNPIMKGIAVQADAQGGNAASAAAVMTEADAHSAGLLHATSSDVAATSVHISRPINV